MLEGKKGARIFGLKVRHRRTNRIHTLEIKGITLSAAVQADKKRFLL